MRIHLIAVVHRFETIFGRAQKTAHRGIVRKFNRIVPAAHTVQFRNIVDRQRACDIRVDFFDAHTDHQNAGGLSDGGIVSTKIASRTVIRFKKIFKGKQRHKPLSAV